MSSIHQREQSPAACPTFFWGVSPTQDCQQHRCNKSFFGCLDLFGWSFTTTNVPGDLMTPVYGIGLPPMIDAVANGCMSWGTSGTSGSLNPLVHHHFLFQHQFGVHSIPGIAHFHAQPQWHGCAAQCMVKQRPGCGRSFCLQVTPPNKP